MCTYLHSQSCNTSSWWIRCQHNELIKDACIRHGELKVNQVRPILVFIYIVRFNQSLLQFFHSSWFLWLTILVNPKSFCSIKNINYKSESCRLCVTGQPCIIALTSMNREVSYVWQTCAAMTQCYVVHMYEWKHANLMASNSVGVTSLYAHC